MDFTIVRNRSPLRLTLALDAAFEFAAGTALLLFAGTIADWFGIATTVTVSAGVIFIIAGFAITSMLLSAEPDAGLVRPLAWANIAGGVAGWVVFVAAWSQLEPEARWLLGLASDSFILVGVLELLALRTRRA